MNLASLTSLSTCKVLTMWTSSLASSTSALLHNIKMGLPWNTSIRKKKIEYARVFPIISQFNEYHLFSIRWRVKKDTWEYNYNLYYNKRVWIKPMTLSCKQFRIKWIH